MAAILFHEPIFGTVVEEGDLLYFYEVATTTDLTVYTDFALTTPATQPEVAGADGRFIPLYIDATGNDPKIVLKDSGGVEKWTCLRYPVEDLTQLQVDLDAAEAAIIVNQGNIATNSADIDALELESIDYEARLTALEAVTGAVSLSDFTGANQNLASTGFQNLPGGLKLQWGKQSSVVTSGGAGTAIDVSFNEAFPTACLFVGASEGTEGFPSNSSNWGGSPAKLKSASQFTFYQQTGKTRDIFWFAIGH